MQRLFACQQAVAENESRPLHHNAPVIARLIVDEQFLNELGMIELVDLSLDRSVMDQIAVAASIVGEKIDRTLAKDFAAEETRQKRRSRRVG